VELVVERPPDLLLLSDDESVSYDLRSSSRATRRGVEQLLRERRIRFVWDHGYLVVERIHEAVTDDVLDKLDVTDEEVGDAPAGIPLHVGAMLSRLGIALLAGAFVSGVAGVARTIGYPGGFEEIKFRVLAYGFGTEVGLLLLAGVVCAFVVGRSPVGDRRIDAIAIAASALGAVVIIVNAAYAVDVAIGRSEYVERGPTAIRISEVVQPLPAIILAAAAVAIVVWHATRDLAVDPDASESPTTM
jgi:hypothetical protein